MRDKNKHTLLNRYIKVTVSVLIILTCFIVLKFTHGSRIFKKYVCNPIPKSVRNIKTHGQGWPSWDTFSHRYVMHFKISKTDVERILTSRRFKEMMSVKYKDGILWWMADPSQGRSLPLYASYKDRPGPEWFRPDLWNNSKVYSFEERTISYQEHVQILIHNEDIAEAYLVEYQEGHR